MNDRNNQFTLEITTTALCNLGCTYCFEGVKTDKQRLDDKVDLVKLRIKEFYESKFFNDNYDDLNISFWGGEPTLNGNLIVDIMQEFQHHDNISFHIYTNAYNKKRLDTIIDNVDLKKLAIQVSYDGKDINDIFRLTLTGKPTSDQVVENIKYLAERGVNVSIKSTIPLKTMKRLHKTWLDFKKLYDELNSIGENISVAYAPTIDYVDDLPRDEAVELVEEFRKQMLLIAKEEIKFFKIHGHHLCTWFNGSDAKQHCASGAHMHAINVDGKSYACHGSLYSPNKDDMQGSDIHSISFVDDIEKMSKAYQVPIREVSDTCKGCVATTCMICPVASLDRSKAENYFDRWTDRWVNNMCGFFKAFGEIDRTVQAYLDNDLKIKSTEGKELIKEIR